MKTRFYVQRAPWEVEYRIMADMGDGNRKGWPVAIVDPSGAFDNPEALAKAIVEAMNNDPDAIL